MRRARRGGPIVHLTTGRPPYETRTYHAESRTLLEAGYDVWNITPGHVSSDEGVHIVAVRPPRSRAERMLITPWVVALRARRLAPAAWHLHDANLIPAGLLLRLLGQCVIYDAHEILASQVRDRTWIPRPLRAPAARLAALVESLAVWGCSATIFGEPAAARGRRARASVVVRNFPRLDDEDVAPSRRVYIERNPVVLYTGDITRTRGAREMVMSVARVPSARLALVGRIGIPGLADELRALEGWSRVDFGGWADQSTLRQQRRRARIGLAVLHPTAQYLESVPTKLFEYMAAGLPVIASDFEAWRSVVQPSECGVLVDPRDVEQIADAIAGLLSKPEEAWAMGQRGRAAIETTFNWTSEGERLLKLYGHLIGPPRAAGAPTRA